MDEETAINLLSISEKRILRLTEDNANYGVQIINYQAFVGMIPRALPDGKAVTAYEWILWAKEKLGYETNGSKSSDFSP